MDERNRYKAEVMNHVLNESLPQNQTTSDIYYWKKEDYSKKSGRSSAFTYILYFMCVILSVIAANSSDTESKHFSVMIKWQQIYLDFFVYLFVFFAVIFIWMRTYIRFVEKPKEEMIKKSESYIKVFDDRLELKYLPGSMKINVFNDDQPYSDMIIYYNNIQSIHIKGPDFFKSLNLFSNVWLRGLELYRRCYRDIYIVKTDGDRAKFPELMLWDFFEIEMKRRKINIVRDN